MTKTRQKQLNKQQELHAALVEKLHPSTVRTSPFFTAILAAMLGQEGWTNPELTGLYCTSDGFILGSRVGDVGYNVFLCSRAELLRNCEGIAEFMELNAEETGYLFRLVPSYHLGESGEEN